MNVKLSYGMMMFLFISACTDRNSELGPGDEITYSEIDFKFIAETADNEIFRRRLINLATTEQLRFGPMGVSAGVYGAPDYTIQIVGKCEGAIDELGRKLVRLTSDWPGQSSLMKSYYTSAVCAVKHHLIDNGR